MTTPQMMAACPQYQEDECEPCYHAFEHVACGCDLPVPKNMLSASCPACILPPAAEQPTGTWADDEPRNVHAAPEVCLCNEGVFNHKCPVHFTHQAPSPPPRKTARPSVLERIEWDAKVSPGSKAHTHEYCVERLDAAIRVIAAADAREDALREENAALRRDREQRDASLSAYSTRCEATMKEQEAQLAAANEQDVTRLTSERNQSDEEVARLARELGLAEQTILQREAECFDINARYTGALVDLKAAEQKAANAAESLRVALLEVERLRELLRVERRAPGYQTLKDMEHERDTLRERVKELLIERDLGTGDLLKKIEAAEARIIELERIVAAMAVDDHDWEREKRRDDLIKMVQNVKRLPYMVQISHDGNERYYNYQNDAGAIAEAAATLAAIDAHVAEKAGK